MASLQQRLHLRRPLAALVAGALVWLLARAVSASVANAQLSGSPSLLVQVDAFTANFLVPLVSLLTAFLVGWWLKPAVLRPQFPRESNVSFSLWRGLLRYIAPPAILVLMLVGHIL